MKMDMARALGVAAVVVAGAVAMVSCGRNTEPSGVGERTGTALDRAAEKTAEAAKAAASATKDAAGKAVEKTGAAVEKTGENMQK